MLVDYLIDRPKRKISFKRSLVWLAFPLLYLLYSLIRGAAVGWYPYPFLNPNNHGYGSIALVSLGLLVMGVGLVWVITKLSGKSKVA